MTSQLSVEEQLLNRIKERLQSAIQEAQVAAPNRIAIIVDKNSVQQVAIFLRDELGFDHTNAVAGVDYPPPENKLVAVYFAQSYTRPELARVILSMKVKLDRSNPVTPSLYSVWPSVLYFEREAWEMFGIVFEGHPRLDLLFLRDNWEGPPPMRKDMKFPEMG